MAVTPRRAAVPGPEQSTAISDVSIQTVASIGPHNAFARRLTGDWTLVLLEQGTCCWRAGELFAEHAFERRPDTAPVSSFEEARNLGRGAQDHIVLVPHLHPIVGDFETSASWASLTDFLFVLPNPPLYLASSPGTSLATTALEKCASIARLQNLVDRNTAPIAKWMDAANTQHAADLCASGQAQYCITNHEGLTRFDLTKYSRLKDMSICWHPYLWTR